MPEHKQLKIASETLYIYAPLAHRIGLYNIKTALEDLSLKYTEPDIYQEILSKIKESKTEQNQYIEDFSSVLTQALDREKIKYQIKGRPKSIFSIRKKMQSQGVRYEEIYDKFAIRIIYKAKPEQEKFLAWKIYSVVTDHYTPNPVRLRDWISSPKSTGYEALHITVMGPKNRWVEVQIRSERMHEIAEKGYAAHFKYKHGDQKEKGIDLWLNRLQEALENAHGNAIDFVEEFKLNLYAKEIFVFTPKGDLKSLPKNATPLDFAFHVHTEIGMKTRGAKVNGKLVPLNTTLKSGDQVEIITSETIKPNPNWVNYATTARAISRIKSALKEERRTIAEQGKEILRRKLRTQKIKLDESMVNKLVVYFKLKTSLDLFYQVGVGAIDNHKLKDFSSSYNNTILRFFKDRIRRKPSAPAFEDEASQVYDTLVFGKEGDRLEYTLSPCCNPIPGDDVFGFITIKDGIKVHKKNCPNSVALQAQYAYRIIQAQWIDSAQQDFPVDIKLSGIDHLGLVSQITHVISNTMNVNMKKISFSTEGGTFEGSIRVVVDNNDTLAKLLKHLGQLKGIDKVVRI